MSPPKKKQIPGSAPATGGLQFYSYESLILDYSQLSSTSLLSYSSAG